MTTARRPGELATDALGDPRAIPDIEWIRALTGASEAQVTAILAETDALVPVETAMRARQLDGGRSNYAQFRAPFDLYAIARLNRPAHVVETGVSSGISSAHFLLALRANHSGTLHSIDLPTPQVARRLAADESIVSIPPGRSSGWAMPENLRPGWDLHLGPSQALLPVLAQGVERVDLFLHDSLHTPEHLTFELETLRSRFLPGAVVLADNTEWTGDSFERFARTLGVAVHHRGGSDLVGLRVP
ncbi:MAG TPA: class I SAM-dependent methyltransferase, partial [Thermoplasmata archaeon]